ncbi:MAG: HAMP domain-containing sensor histidine kinase [Reinekea sp.]|jgi:K+-sensing histidine kinase KdpD
MEMQTVMASMVHDVKNSLGLMTNQLDTVYNRLADLDPEAAQIVRRLQLECGRINNDVVHMLGLYKLQSGMFTPSFDEVYVPDIIDDVGSRYRDILHSMGIELIVNFDNKDCVWCLDSTLVEGLLTNVITNAIRYTKSSLQFFISQTEDGWLHIRIVDDGNGFPDAMINILNQPESVCFQSGATGLGLYFCQQIAQMHQHDGHNGYIELSNRDQPPGAVFDLWLP